jgi:spoIIIJ-associated protein
MEHMEWVETTAKTVEEAKELALDRLGVAEDDAEFEVLETPRSGLFGMMRGEARVRARVRPTEARPKQERRRSGRRQRGGADGGEAGSTPADHEGSATAVLETDEDGGDAADEPVGDGQDESGEDTGAARRSGTNGGTNGNGNGNGRSRNRNGRSRGGRSDRAQDAGSPEGTGARDMTDMTDNEVDPAAVGEAARGFVSGFLDAFGATATTEVVVEGDEIDVRVEGEDLGLLIGPGGRTLLALQDVTRVAAQRRLGDHETRLRVDVAGYRERRRVALERFARSIAEQVIETGTAKALEPMPSADRKVIHDVLATIDGVTSRSDGEDPYRRVVIVPA